jgi:lipopolysaccharide assembly protein A
MMKQLVWCFKWLLNGAIFFTLFAFALNNQQDATVHFFFGTQWRSPMVLIVLAAFAAGLAVGVLGMVPRWWKQRSAVTRNRKSAQEAAQQTAQHAAGQRAPAGPDRRDTSPSQPALPPAHGL